MKKDTNNATSLISFINFIQSLSCRPSISMLVEIYNETLNLERRFLKSANVRSLYDINWNKAQEILRESFFFEM